MKKLVKSHGNLTANSEQQLQAWAKTGKQNEGFFHLLHLLSQTLDYAITNGDTWVTIGVTRNQDALMMTLNCDGSKGYITGATYLDLARACQDYISALE